VEGGPKDSQLDVGGDLHHDLGLGFLDPDHGFTIAIHTDSQE